MKIYFEYPTIFVVIAVVLAAVISFLLYYKDKSFSGLKPWKKNLMTALRFIFVSIILILLLKPVFKTTDTIVQKPIIVFAQDNSKSILLNKDSLYYNSDYKNDINNLLEDLSETYDVRQLHFSEATYSDSSTNFLGDFTDISSVFTETASRYSGMNMGAIILATDGIYNRGNNPVYIQNINIPVYPIALGDTIAQKDLIIKDIMHNRVAFLGNKFPLRIFVGAEKVAEKEAQIIIRHDKQTVYSSIFTTPHNSSVSTLEIELPANKLGIQQYEISLTPLADEISYENNNTTFIINIIDNRNKILLLANAPHPDIGAINYAIKDNPDFEIDIRYITEFNSNISDYDLVILHQLPSVKNNPSNIFAEIEKNSIPTLHILGTSSAPRIFNNLNTGFEIIQKSTNLDDAQPYYNQSFVSFSLDTDPSFFKTFSPLKVFFGDYNVTSDAKTLLYQTVNGVKTEKTLIAFVENKSVKNGLIAGEGLWKWRIDDFKANNEHTSFNSLINRIVQYLIVKNIKDQLIIEAKQIFNENEPVILNSEFYNEAFEIVPNLDVELTLKNDEDKEFKYTFGNFGNGYRLNLGRLNAGTYKYTATTKFDNKNYSVSGNFIVQKINIEFLNTIAAHNMLHKLAEISNGKVFYPANIRQIKNELNNNTNVTNIAYSKEKLYSIIDIYYIFFIILLFAACEWGLRKFWGGY